MVSCGAKIIDLAPNIGVLGGATVWLAKTKVCLGGLS
uniref:Uncharacterized protein n=1 Tax=Pithovirus LCPAC202 TaxID=2506592 RepID=A0A481Z589_9VIRU|nr:MAG: hypothetical protein LCPAC202_00270 [Pithovirus LCPAC202]